MAKPPFLPIINTGDRAYGFAGLISDTSLLDVETIGIDRQATGTATGLLFRAGTVALVTRVSPKTGSRYGKPAVASNAGATPAGRFVAISFSHDTCNQQGEIYYKQPDTAALFNTRPANGVNTGRVWLFLNGARPSAAALSAGAKVGVADLPTGGGAFDATKPLVNGAVKVAVTTAGSENVIPGWTFTGHFAVDPASGYNIAEIEIKRA